MGTATVECGHLHAPRDCFASIRTVSFQILETGGAVQKTRCGGGGGGGKETQVCAEDLRDAAGMSECVFSASEGKLPGPFFCEELHDML